MTFVKDILFGKKGKGGQVVDTTPAEFEGLRPEIAQQIRDIFATGGGPTFAGPLTADITAPEQEILNRISGRGESPLLGQASDFLGRTLQGDFLQGNPFLNQMIDTLQRRELENFQRNVDPRLRQRFTAAGQFVQPGGSSPFDVALAQSSSDLFNRLADISTGLSFQGFEAERGRQQEAVGQALNISREDLNQGIAQLQAVALPRLIEQQGLELGLQEFQRRMGMLLQALQLAGGIASPTVAQTQGTQGTQGIAGEVLSAFLKSKIA